MDTTGDSKAAKSKSTVHQAINKEAKKLTNPTNKIQNTYVGIKDTLKESIVIKAEEKTEEFKNKPQKSFTIDQLRMNWRKYAFKMKEEGLGTLYTAMNSGDPSLVEGHKIKYIVENNVQLQFIQSKQLDILTYLRKELQNWSIELEVEEKIEEGGKVFSSKDKFKEMAKKNPHLETLRNKFKLDIDL